jgi:hypothetical protein
VPLSTSRAKPCDRLAVAEKRSTVHKSTAQMSARRACGPAANDRTASVTAANTIEALSE